MSLMYITHQILADSKSRKNFRLARTWEEGDEGAVRVWALFEVRHHLRGALPRVAAHGRAVPQVSRPAHRGDHLPVTLVHGVFSLLELHLRHCGNKQTSH